MNKNLKFKIENLRSRGAFSFVEVMVTVFLVSVGLLAALSLLTKGLAETMDSRNQVIASLLAQEGVELVRAMRDNNIVDVVTSGGDSFKGISDSDKKIDYSSLALSGDGDNTKLKISTNGFYDYSASGTATKFLRKIDITLTPAGDPTQATVSSMVVWNGKATNQFKDSLNVDLTTTTCNSANKCAYAVDILTDWAQ